MFLVRKVVGESMSPTLHLGQTVVFKKSKNYKVGDTVLAKVKSREVVKRIKEISPNGVFLIGDNNHKSTDSRTYGEVKQSLIVGKMIWPLNRKTTIGSSAKS